MGRLPLCFVACMTHARSATPTAVRTRHALIPCGIRKTSTVLEMAWTPVGDEPPWRPNAATSGWRSHHLAAALLNGHDSGHLPGIVNAQAQRSTPDGLPPATSRTPRGPCPLRFRRNPAHPTSLRIVTGRQTHRGIAQASSGAGCRPASDPGPFHHHHRPAGDLCTRIRAFFTTVIAQRVILISPPTGPHCGRTKP